MVEGKDDLDDEEMDDFDDKVEGMDKQKEGKTDREETDEKGIGQEEQGKGKGKGSKPCKFFDSREGCTKGGECTFVHVTISPSEKNRCWNCGGEGHRSFECIRPRGKKGGNTEKKNTVQNKSKCSNDIDIETDEDSEKGVRIMMLRIGEEGTEKGKEKNEEKGFLDSGATSVKKESQ